MTTATTVCANCGGPVIEIKGRLVCRECGTRRQDQSALAPSQAEIARLKAELRKYPVNTEE